MTKVTITILCIFCLIMSGIMIAGGFTTYSQYKATKTNEQMGNEILSGAEDTAEGIKTTAQVINGTVNFFTTALPNVINRIPTLFENMGEIISEWFRDLGAWFARLWLNFLSLFDGNITTTPPSDGSGFGGGAGGAR